MELTRIQYKNEKNLSIINLNAPDDGNVIDDRTVRELTEAFLFATRDPQSKVIVLNVEGEDSSLPQKRSEPLPPTNGSFQTHQEYARRFAKLLTMIATIRKPIVVSAKGEISADACALISVCDIVVAAAQDSIFRLSDIAVGDASTVIIPFLSAKIGEPMLHSLLLMNRNLTSQEAFEKGLVHILVPELDLLKTTVSIAATLIKAGNLAFISLLKDTFARIQNMNFTEAVDYCVNVHAIARMTEDPRKSLELFGNETKKSG
jgi:enoyl-CoA hydratase/carnithine racemase